MQDAERPGTAEISPGRMASVSLPFDDATLAEALEGANLPALLPAIAQLTGDRYPMAS